MEYATIYIILAASLGLFMAWGIGANDVANAMATSVGSRALTIRQAVVVAAIFEFAGAVLAGGAVASTVRGGIIKTSELAGAEQTLIFGMLAALAAAGVWLLIASWRGWPVSTTHSIIGALVGFGIAGLGWGAIYWPTVGQVAASWVTSPLIAGLVSFLLFRSVQLLVLDRATPLEAAKRWVPYYIFLTGFFVSLITLLRGLQYIGLELSFWEGCALSIVFGLAMTLLGKVMINRLKLDTRSHRRYQYHNVERVFAVLMIVTACAMAFAHGSNDVANAIGPVAAVVATATSGDIQAEAPVPLWLLVMGAFGIVVGLLMLGKHVIATVGRNITQLTPSRGFACNLATAGTVVTASGAGMPISTTHTLVGAVLGVGLARGLAAIDLRVVGTVFMSWLVTLPAGAILAILFFYLFSWTLG
ncbi:inorganic phosphate transporter [Halorhodospira halochloris]|uniref:Phosphate transporter n=1 Tax=Halorhodospira halochloris TaxID=1052 RepID=A0A0X8X6K2_HALHR|nr:inorganic phosphate transporter [Halorhodospira halochloris]MBK1650946.1 phosphate permease [Halorhodospira halochloris]MCG5529312.1 inorganic phosphate transporter [Halorhodospira halochloris]BAU56549.1 probable low-affinity inorganic phosphate transporter [Halorhodospira halochloris]